MTSVTAAEPTLKDAIDALNFNWPTGGRKTNYAIKMMVWKTVEAYLKPAREGEALAKLKTWMQERHDDYERYLTGAMSDMERKRIESWKNELEHNMDKLAEIDAESKEKEKVASRPNDGTKEDRKE